jgi:hypothetical protein
MTWLGERRRRHCDKTEGIFALTLLAWPFSGLAANGFGNVDNRYSFPALWFIMES